MTQPITYNPAHHAALLKEETNLLADAIVASPARAVKLEQRAKEIRQEIEALRSGRPEPTPPAPAAPAVRKPRRKAAESPVITITTPLQNEARDTLGIRAWVTSVTERDGRKSVSTHTAYVQWPGVDAEDLGSYDYYIWAENAVNMRCSQLVVILADKAAA